MKQLTFYYLLLTLGVFLSIDIYCPIESFAFAATPSNVSKPERTDVAGMVSRFFQRLGRINQADRLSLTETPFVTGLSPPALLSARDKDRVESALKPAMAMNELHEEEQGLGSALSAVANDNIASQQPLTMLAATSDTAAIPPPMDKVQDCKQAKQLYSQGLAFGDNSEKEAQFYLRAIELCQDFFEAHNKLGEIYKSQGKYDLAIREFTHARKKWHYAKPLINLGEIYRMQGRYDLAETEFIEAVRIRPASRQSLNQLKYIRKRLGEYDFFRETPRGVPTPSAIFTRVPGMTLPKGSWGVDLSYKFWEETSTIRNDMVISGEADFGAQGRLRVRDIHQLILGLRYGLTSNFTIGLRPRYIFRKVYYQLTQAQVSGLGDTNLLMKYHVWGRRRTHISLYHLLSIPTGDEDASTFVTHNVPGRPGTGTGAPLPVTDLFKIPLGSGVYSFTPGIALTTEKNSFTYHANVSYFFSGTDRIADEFRTDLTVVFPRFQNLEAMMEINYRWTNDYIGELLTGDVVIREPEGHTLFLSPGIQFFLPQQYKIEIGFQFPAIKPSDKGAWVETTIFHLGLTKQFF